MSSVPDQGPLFHPGAPHERIKPSQAPQDRSGQPAATFAGDFEGWMRSGQWERVSSSDVSAIAYDLPQRMLKFRFLDGSEFGYFPYSVEEARGLYLTGSKGVFVGLLPCSRQGEQGAHAARRSAA